MATNTIYRYLDSRPEKKSEELFVRGTGIRASTMWHDRYISRMTPDQISSDRDIPVEAAYEALAFCQEEWEEHLTPKGFRTPATRSAGVLRRTLA